MDPQPIVSKPSILRPCKILSRWHCETNEVNFWQLCPVSVACQSLPINVWHGRAISWLQAEDRFEDCTWLFIQGYLLLKSTLLTSYHSDPLWNTGKYQSSPLLVTFNTVKAACMSMLPDCVYKNQEDAECFSYRTMLCAVPPIPCQMCNHRQWALESASSVIFQIRHCSHVEKTVTNHECISGKNASQEISSKISALVRRAARVLRKFSIPAFHISDQSGSGPQNTYDIEMFDLLTYFVHDIKALLVYKRGNYIQLHRSHAHQWKCYWPQCSCQAYYSSLRARSFFLKTDCSHHLSLNQHNSNGRFHQHLKILENWILKLRSLQCLS